MRNLLLLILLILPSFSFSQKLRGLVIDSITSDPLIGVSVYIPTLKIGTMTDLDGNFSLNISDTNYIKVEFKYVSYKPHSITTNSKDSSVVVRLQESVNQLTGITITSTTDKGSMSELSRLQSKSANLLDGLSSEQIKKSPDSKVSDVFKRISGASVQDGGFLVIRGLNDRYNFGLINGSPLPSSESDRRAFSFDIFSSSMIDNIVIHKTATADLPGEFSGGVLNLTTMQPKDINYLSIGLGVNVISTFRNFHTTNWSVPDYLGFNNSDRNLPTGLPSTKDWKLLDKNQKAFYAKKMNYDWQSKNKSSLPIGQISYTLGKEVTLKKNRSIGFITSWYYQNSEVFNKSIRRDFEEQDSIIVLKTNLQDSVFTKTVLNTGMFNFVFRLDNENSLTSKNIFSTSTQDRVNVRVGVRECDNDPRQWERSTNFWLSQNQMYSSQLLGDHNFKFMKINWNSGFSDVRRSIPNLRRIVYRKYSLFENDTTEDYVSIVQTNGTIPTASGNMFWSNSWEKIYSFSDQVLISFNLQDFDNMIKLGTWHQFRQKDFVSRNFGFSQYKPTGSQFDSNLLLLSPDEIFSENNLGLLSNGKGGFKLEEATNVDDNYDASSNLNAGFLMFENNYGKFRLVSGIRFEQYQQTFNYVEFGSNILKSIDTTVLDKLPSFNLIYSVSDKLKIRAAFSKTVSRPEFRELAPFSFYNFILDNITSGNPNLQRTQIDNFDLRLEYFTTNNQMFSVSGFYKSLKNPIEIINRTGTSGAAELYYTNVDSAKNLGTEVEMRFNIGKMLKKEFFSNFNFYTNASYIQSTVNLQKVIGSGGTRPLQGQSPYIINTGLFFQNSEKNLSVNLSYNVIGPRVFIVGNVQEPTVWENKRHVLDLQLSYKKMEKLELKLNVKDVIAQKLLFFQDLNGNTKYDNIDNRWQEVTFGQLISASIGYKF